MKRREFLGQVGAVAALSAGLPLVSRGAGEAPARLKSWELIELPHRKPHFREHIKITADNGAVGYARALGGVNSIDLAEKAVAGANLLDHEALYDLMVVKGVSERERKVLDIACWDLHARMHDKPLHALLGTKKDKILRYGDVRWNGKDMTPDKYAGQVASYLKQTGMIATKLHFPGNMGNEESIPFKDVMATLRAVRKAVGDDMILAWDPYPGQAESATTSLDEAKEIILLMDELNYSWFEGPLPPSPYDEQIP